MGEQATLIVATDLSAPSVCAVQQALDLAQCLGVKTVLTYVVEDRLPPLILAQVAKSEKELIEGHRRNADRALTEFARKHFPDAALELVVRTGQVHTEIVALAREREARMIVVGMHGHGFLTHALAGSTAERVLHAAHCPVLVVPEK